MTHQAIPKRLRSRFAVFCLTACLGLHIGLHTSNSHARESDLDQPIDVSADRSEYDDRAGTQLLIGNVEIRQGTMRITADEIAITLENNALSRIDGKGSPIKFEQENEAGELMRGEAGEISYNAIEGTLVLSGTAKLVQPRRNLTSERIEFNVKTQRVSAEGSKESGRVTIRLEAPKR